MDTDLVDEEGDVMLLDVHEAQLRREHQRLSHCHLRAVDVILLHIPTDPGKGSLHLRVAVDADVACGQAACNHSIRLIRRV